MASGSVCIGSTIYSGSISSGHYSSVSSNTCSNNNVVATYYACASGSATGVALTPNPYTVQTCTANVQLCSNAACIACGGANQICCSGGTCPSSPGGYVCQSGTCQLPCGNVGQPCCNGNSCPFGTSAAPLMCVSIMYYGGTECVSCGSSGYDCCGNPPPWSWNSISVTPNVYGCPISGSCNPWYFTC